MKKLFLITVLIILLSLLISCAEQAQPEDSTTPPPEDTSSYTEADEETDTSLYIVSDGLSDYTIVYPQGASSKIRSAAFGLVSKIKLSTNVALRVSSADAGSGAHEIVIGECDRPDVAAIKSKLASESDFAIVCSDERVYIIGGSTNATIDAIEYFGDIYCKTDSPSISLACDFSYYLSDSFQFSNPLEGIYNYCPSVMLTDENTAYIYYCTNKESYVIIDYIGCRKGVRGDDGTWSWGEEFIVLSPTEKAWDEHHTCDPSVIAGNFNYNGEKYSYLMAYLGCDLISNDSQDNKIGLAVAKSPEGPFIKVGSAPFVDFEFQYSPDIWEWGVGQPSIVNLNREGRIMLFYTRGDRNGTRVLYEEWELSDLSSPQKLSEGALSTKGLTNLYGNPDFMNNADFVYDAKQDRYYAISECHPTLFPDDPNMVSALQISYCEGTADLSNVEWNQIEKISKYQTGFYSNHNAGFLRDAYGYLADDFLTVFYTYASQTQDLWTFKICNHFIDVQ